MREIPCKTQPVVEKRTPELSELTSRGFSGAAAGEYTLAAEAWAELRRHYPGEAVGWVHGAYALAKLGSREDALALIDQAGCFVTATIELPVARAYIVAQGGDRTATAAAWLRARELSPALPDGWVHGAEVAAAGGDHAVAEALVTEGKVRFPGDASAVNAGASIIERREKLINNFPNYKQNIKDNLEENKTYSEFTAVKYVTKEKIVDTYYYLLERSRYNEMDDCNKNFEYMSAYFSKDVYERSRGMKFNNREDAYRDWMKFGKATGLEFAESKNSILKIILKVKNEPFLLEKWIEYHANIVGFHNIIIVDCGSNDCVHWKIIEKYKSKLLIFKYNWFFNDIHSSEANRSFFDLISKNCKFLTVIDADEFLFGISDNSDNSDNSVSGMCVVDILNFSNEGILAGTWFNNIDLSFNNFDEIQWNDEISFCVDDASIYNGTISGKSIVRSDLIFAVKHIGHNLHVRDVIEKMTANSFGKIGILHLQNLGENINRLRALKHLESKGIIPDKRPTNMNIEYYIRDLLEDNKLSGANSRYAKKYLEPKNQNIQCSTTFKTKILSSFKKFHDKILFEKIKKFDFISLLRNKSIWYYLIYIGI